MTTIKLRRGDSGQWAAVNPTLDEGEPGFEEDTGFFKLGDGVTPWAELEYFYPTGGVSPDFVKRNLDEEISGEWNFLVPPLIDGEPIGTGGGDGGIVTLTYANAMTGTRFTILYNGTAWPATRPSNRTDIYFDMIGGSSSVADPGWMINGDAREIVL